MRFSLFGSDPRSSSIRFRGAAVLLGLALVASACGGGSTADSATVETPTETAATSAPLTTPEPATFDNGLPEPEMAGVTTFDLGEVGHTTDPVNYEQSPPVGGNHNPGWQNCGFYEVELPNEQAVHSLEHGAVWVTFQPGAPEAELQLLRDLAAADTHLLVSPYPSQDTTFVVTAWERQMTLDSVADPSFDEFIDLYIKDGPTAPEPNVTCASAYGIPPLDVTTIDQ